jgi:uncharacterized protein (TIGR00255 family)
MRAFQSAATGHTAGMHSMTGFGRGSATVGDWHATVELAAVNRKQVELVVQLPREIQELDSRIRKAALACVSRGRIQIAVTLEHSGGADTTIRVDKPLAIAFHNAFQDLGKTVGHPLLPAATDFLRQPGILTLGNREMDPENAWRAIQPALQEALGSLNTMRASEGEHLKQDFLDRLAELRSFVASIASEAPTRPLRQRELLLKRLREAGLELDLADERLTRELALFADRCDISEELTRLDSHFAKFEEYLNAADPPGRALDFLCQEIFREFNTIGSKANDAGIAHTIVEAKTALEKIREQVQNVE